LSQSLNCCRSESELLDFDSLPARASCVVCELIFWVIRTLPITIAITRRSLVNGKCVRSESKDNAVRTVVADTNTTRTASSGPSDQATVITKSLASGSGQMIGPKLASTVTAAEIQMIHFLSWAFPFRRGSKNTQSSRPAAPTSAPATATLAVKMKKLPDDAL